MNLLKSSHRYFCLKGAATCICALLCFVVHSQKPASSYTTLYQQFKNPPASAKPWVLWYWMKGSITKEGITADLEAMKEVGLGGAYLCPVKDTANPPLIQPQVRQLTPRFWEMVKHALKESKRLGLQIAMHTADGFATAGGPWITPELSMQKVVWSEVYVQGGKSFNDTLQKPASYQGYYKDIAVFAFPTLGGADRSTDVIKPKVTSSKADVDPQFLVVKGNTQYFRSSDPCWIQYSFEQSFTTRSITIETDGRNYYANKLWVEASDDGKNFKSIIRLEAPRQGWQDNDAPVTHAIPSTTALYFRFRFDKEGSEPGAEDIDAAKWKPSISIKGIRLSSAARIHQYEGKNGSVWRVSETTSTAQIPDSLCVSPNRIINITDKLDANGRLNWKVPAGEWTIIRMGHTSTGHTNYIGGGGIGLECDKFSSDATRIQFNGWFGEAVKQAGPELAREVLKTLYIDSWECGSQNWSPVFREEFLKRRGYDVVQLLPILAGVPIKTAEASESFLHDVRKTISELIVDKFYTTMAEEAKKVGCEFVSEAVAPTMTSDGMLHFKTVDIPMGEFWLRSPTHDKPNDMLDAIHGAHIYGKKIVQAEAFTQLRMAWDEHPGMLKSIGDRNLALGINRLVFHVFTHNPWLRRKPGMTLDGVGLYFQRDQTWFKQSKAWMDYLQRCQALLQFGKPVTDIAVFTGEELPRRAILPDRLVRALPGIFGAKKVKEEELRLANIGQPMRQIPQGVNHVANMADPENWIDPLRGYTYDSYNPDVLMASKIVGGKIESSAGTSYRLLVLPGAYRMSPTGNVISSTTANKIKELYKDGATILINEPGQQKVKEGAGLKNLIDVLKTPGAKGKIINGPYTDSSFDAIGIGQDLLAIHASGKTIEGLAWTHRQDANNDLYFIANQQDSVLQFNLSLRIKDKVPELWDPLTGEVRKNISWRKEGIRTVIPLQLAPNASVFVVFTSPSNGVVKSVVKNWYSYQNVQSINGSWSVRFDTSFGGPAKPVVFDQLTDWSKHSDSAIQYYSGTAIYSKNFSWNGKAQERLFLSLGKVANIATVRLNGIDCGTAWTYPYSIDITKALKKGNNQLTIEVTNTWANRLIGDLRLPESKRKTWTTAPLRLEGKPLLEAGLLGPVEIVSEN